MTDPGEAQLRQRPATSAGARAFVTSPFAKLARTHAASTMADAMVAASLAGSLFFSLPAGDARGPVLRYLIITMLPFAVLSPLVGPAIDRMKGGHRLMLIASTVVRAVLCYLMAQVITGGSLSFFLYALCLLVCQRAYSVARSALVPTVVRSDDALVEANSKLSLISGLAGFIGIVPAAVLLKLFGPQWSLGLAMMTYAAAGVIGLRIAPVRVAEESADETERHELRGGGIILAGSAMGLIRACVGFLTLLVAFDFREGRPAWQFVVVAAVSVAGQLSGAAVAPRIRTLTSEENLLTGVLGLLMVGGLFSLLLSDVAGAAILGSCVGFSAGAGKLAFDSILQRDAPDANRGRAFARFETRFQVTWVIGALVPVAIPLTARQGFVVVFVVALVALASYVVGRLSSAHRSGARQTAASAAAVGIEARFSEVSGEVKGRLAAAPRAAYRRVRSHPRHGPDDRYDDGYGPDDGYEDSYDDGYGPDDRYWLDDRYDDGYPEGRSDDGYGPDDRYDDEDGEEDYDEDAEPEWADGPTRPMEQTRGLAGGSPTAWQPPDDDAEFPWEPPPPPPDDGRYLDDVDPSVANPYPWASEATSPERPGRPF